MKKIFFLLTKYIFSSINIVMSYKKNTNIIQMKKKRSNTVALNEDTNERLDNHIHTHRPKVHKKDIVSLAVDEYLDRADAREQEVGK